MPNVKFVPPARVGAHVGSAVVRIRSAVVQVGSAVVCVGSLRVFRNQHVGNAKSLRWRS